MNPLTQFKTIPLLLLLFALSVTVAPVGATPQSGVVTEFIVGSATAGIDLGDLDVSAKWDIDPTVATQFWKLRIDSMGATDLYVVQITFAPVTAAGPGGTTGWHTHPGPSLVTVVQGAITAYIQGDCTPHVYTAGMSFVDIGAGDVHLLRNEGTVPAVTVAVQFIPHGFPRRLDRDPACPGIQ
jgi:quercetin dioxygenase-like cupin family protein